MYWGIIGVSGIAFACSTEMIPELNEQMKLVPFTAEFRKTLTTVMVVDYAACWIIEVVFKFLFSDLKARDIAERRPDQLERERVRKEAELKVKMAEEEQKRLEQVAEYERKMEEKKRELAERWGVQLPAQNQHATGR
jgi:cation-transporting ATPase 13A1